YGVGPRPRSRPQRVQRAHRIHPPGRAEPPVEQPPRLLVDGEATTRLRVHHRHDQRPTAPAGGGDERVAGMTRVAVLDPDQPVVGQPPLSRARTWTASFPEWRKTPRHRSATW